MHKPVKENLSQSSKKIQVGWDGLITEAREKIRDLQRAVAHFEQNKAKGEPFFGAKRESGSESLPQNSPPPS